MRPKVVWLLLFLAACDEGGPPLDELPLRDTLRADPAVVAALPDEVRVRLAERLEAARAGDHSQEPLPEVEAPAGLLAAADRAREQRGDPPVLIAEVHAHVLIARAQETPNGAAPLPPLEGAAESTAAFEARALAGAAGRTLTALLEVSGAQQLRRVVGWPVGAAAVGDTVYVNASWLVALAGPDPGFDAGADRESQARSNKGAARGARSGRAHTDPPVTTEIQAQRSVSPTLPDGGAVGDPPPSPSRHAPPPQDDTTCGDACVAFGEACVASSNEEDSCSSHADDDDSPPPDSCSSNDGAGESCSGSSGSADDCNNTGQNDDACTSSGNADDCNSSNEGGSNNNCQVGRSRRRRGGGPSFAGVFLPLAFLLVRGRK